MITKILAALCFVGVVAGAVAPASAHMHRHHHCWWHHHHHMCGW